MSSSLTDAQLRAELERCRSCEARPCRSGCPAGCSPADFILAARCGEPSDYRRAAAHILGHNPLGGACGQVCPDTLCMARCSRRALDAPIDIPAVQAAIVRRARELRVLPRLEPRPATGQRVAVVGAGPAGLGAAAVLARAGHAVRVFDREHQAGGMARLIPRERLDPEVLQGDLDWLLGLGDVRLELGKPVALPRDLLARGFAAVIVTAGLGEPVELDVPGHERALRWTDVLGATPPPLGGRRVAVIGDGGVAVDCALAARSQGAAHVELFALRTLFELALGRRERDRLLGSGVHASFRVRVTAIRGTGRGRAARVTGLALRKVALPAGETFHPSRLADLPHGAHERRDFDAVVVAIGGRATLRREPHPRVIYAGDLETGPTTVVEALASGKRAGQEVHRLLAGEEAATCPDRPSCPEGGGACPKRSTCPEWNRPAAGGGASPARPAPGLPVPLAADFFGRPIASPLLLRATPTADGHALLKRAYEAGWAGGVIRTAPGHTPSRLLGVLGRLRHEFPDRLTLAGVDHRFTGDDGAGDRAARDEVRRLEAAGAMAIELSLAGPLPASWERSVDAILSETDPAVPKLFRLDAAAVVAPPALAAFAAALARHPGSLAGVTLVGSSPEGGPSDLPGAIAAAVRLGLVASCDGSPTDYRDAAALLASGARTVQVGALALTHGLGVVGELHAGLSYLLAERGLRSVAESVGSALGVRAPSTDGLLCTVDAALCTGCGNCTRCPHLAISLDAKAIPVVDPARCTGCALCVEACFTGALSLRARPLLA